MLMKRRMLVFKWLVLTGLLLVLAFSEYLQLTGLVRMVVKEWSEEE